MSAERFHGLDACRAAAMMLGLFFHGAISFLQSPIPWATRDRSTSPAVDALVWVCHTFRMPVFFLLAGFFGRLLYLKLGAAGFLRHRAKRLLLPFAVTLVPLMPSLYLLWTWGASSQPDRPPVFGMETPSLELDSLTISPGHLWFLYYLMMLLAATVLVVAVASRLPLQGPLRAVDAALGWIVRRRVTMLVMAIPTAATLHPMFSLSCDTPIDFLPQPRILAYYAVFIAFGWLLHRRPELVAEFGRGLWIPLMLAAAALVPLGGALDRLVREGRPADPAAWMGGLYLAALFGWSLVVLFLGAFVKWGSKPRAWVSYLSDASYWCYLVHLPIVVAFQILVSDLAWPGLLKYAIVMTATIAACLGSYHAFVRYTFIGAALNGPRERPVPAPVTP